MLPLAVEIVDEIQLESLPNGGNQQRAMRYVELLLNGYGNEKVWKTIHPEAYEKKLKPMVVNGRFGRVLNNI